MTQQEFHDLIDSYHKQRGTYTSDEIYQIGLAFKQLPKKQKDYLGWEGLVEILGLDISAGTYRSYINKRFNRELKKTNKSFTMTKEEAQIYNAKQRVRDELNEYRKLIRENARLDEFKDNIIEASHIIAEKYPFNFKHSYIFDKNNNNEAIALFSDLHIGAECDNFANKYNLQIATERVKKYTSEIIRLCKNNNVKTLHILNLADNIHGYIHTSLRIENEMNVVDQIISASEIIANFLYELESNIEVVTYRSVVGNHCRMSADKNQNIAKENFGKIIDFYLKERMKNSKIKFMTDNLDDGLGKFRLKNGKLVMFSHGHEDNIKTSLQACVGASKEWVDYFLMAHFHNSSLHQCEGFKVIVNGSFVGTEQYALSKRLFNRAEQKLLIFNGDSLLNIDVDLQEVV